MPCVNILYVITKLELGGAQKQLLSLIRQLNKERFKPFLFAAREGLLIPEASSIPELTIKNSRYLERPINPLLDILAFFELYRFIKKNRIGFVHTHSSKAGIIGRLAARLAGAKNIVHTVHGWSFNDSQNPVKRRLFIFLERIACGREGRLIVVSSHDRSIGLSCRIGSAERYKLIRYGIEKGDFNSKAPTLRSTLGIGASDRIVGMVSCLKPQKSPEDFLRLAKLVLRDMPEVKFILAGDGPLRQRLAGSIKKSGIGDKVILLGWRRDIPQLLSILDIVVLTSLWEGLPLSVLEALASAKPVVATDTGGVREVIFEGRNGFLVERRDMDKMSSVVRKLLEDGALREAMGKEARASLGDNFSVEKYAQATEALYSRMLSGIERHN